MTPRRATPAQVEAALAASGRDNALLAFAPGSDGTPAAAIGPAAPGLIDDVAAWLRIGERRVAASLVVLGYAARLVGPTVAVLLRDGLLVDAGPGAVRFGFAAGRGFALSLPAPAGWYGRDAADWRRDVVAGHLGVVIAAVRADTPVSARLLWGNVASGLLGALGAVARSGAVPVRRCRAFAGAALADGPLAGSGTVGPSLTFRRATCCLYYRIPGGGYCGDCALRRDVS